MSFELPPLSTDPPDANPTPAPAEAPRRRFRSWPLPAQLAVGCGSGCAVLALAQVLVVWGSLSLMAHLRPPEGLHATVQHPPTARVGTKIPLTLTVENRGQTEFTVQNVIGRPALVEKLALSNPRPKPKDENNVMGQATWSYMQKVQPGEKWTLQFDARPVRSGTIDESLEVQVNLAPVSVRVKLTAK